MAIYVEFAGDLLHHENRHNNFGLGLQGTGKVAGIFADIVNHNRLPAGSGSPANPLVERDSRVRSHGAHKSLQHQHRRLGAGLEHVKANPIVFKHALVQQRAHALHQFLGRSRRLRKGRNFVANLFDSSSDGHEQNLNSA